MPDLRSEVGPLTPRLEKVIHTLEWVRIEEFVESTWCCVGRPPHDRGYFSERVCSQSDTGLNDNRGVDRTVKGGPGVAADMRFFDVEADARPIDLLTGL